MVTTTQLNFLTKKEFTLTAHIIMYISAENIEQTRVFLGLRIIKNKKMFGQKKIKNGTKSKIQINITVEKSVI